MPQCQRIEIENQSLVCNGLEVLKGLDRSTRLVVTSQFAQNVNVLRSNKTRTRVCPPKGTSRYNLKILLRADLFPRAALLPHTLRSGYRKRCRYRT